MKPLAICQPLSKYNMFTFVVLYTMCFNFSFLYRRGGVGGQSFAFLVGEHRSPTIFEGKT